MKNSLKVMIIAFGLAFTALSARAMSELASITVTPLWPTNSNPGNTVFYEVMVERTGQGLLAVNLSASDLPEGCVATLTAGSLRYTGNDPRFQYFTLAVTGPQPTPVDSFPFTVTGAAQRETVTHINAPVPVPISGNPAPTMVSITASTGGDMELRGQGETGQSYRIEATHSLQNPVWSEVGSCTADGNGRFTFKHVGAQSASVSMRFYRAAKITGL